MSKNRIETKENQKILVPNGKWEKNFQKQKRKLGFFKFWYEMKKGRKMSENGTKMKETLNILRKFGPK